MPTRVSGAVRGASKWSHRRTRCPAMMRGRPRSRPVRPGRRIRPCAARSRPHPCGRCRPARGQDGSVVMWSTPAPLLSDQAQVGQAGEEAGPAAPRRTHRRHPPAGRRVVDPADVQMRGDLREQRAPVGDRRLAARVDQQDHRAPSSRERHGAGRDDAAQHGSGRGGAGRLRGPAGRGFRARAGPGGGGSAERCPARPAARAWAGPAPASGAAGRRRWPPSRGQTRRRGIRCWTWSALLRQHGREPEPILRGSPGPATGHACAAGPPWASAGGGRHRRRMRSRRSARRARGRAGGRRGAGRTWARRWRRTGGSRRPRAAFGARSMRPGRWRRSRLNRAVATAEGRAMAEGWPLFRARHALPGRPPPPPGPELRSLEGLAGRHRCCWCMTRASATRCSSSAMRLCCGSGARCRVVTAPPELRRLLAGNGVAVSDVGAMRIRSLVPHPGPSPACSARRWTRSRRRCRTCRPTRRSCRAMGRPAAATSVPGSGWSGPARRDRTIRRPPPRTGSAASRPAGWARCSSVPGVTLGQPATSDRAGPAGRVRPDAGRVGISPTRQPSSRGWTWW